MGWLGTGRMGAAMATRLIDAGTPVTVWTRTTSKTGPLVARGAVAAAGVTDLSGCAIVFVTVSTPADLEQVIMGDHGLLERDANPRDHRRLLYRVGRGIGDSSRRGRGRRPSLSACPISGNPHVVAEGRACLVASGPADVFDRARPYLEQIAKVVVYAGQEEQSPLAELCHNLYLGMMVQALVEVTSLAEVLLGGCRGIPHSLASNKFKPPSSAAKIPM